MRIFVGCSASNNIPREYFDECKSFLLDLMKEHDLVFGACNSGLMGVAYDITLSLGNKIIGICPEAYKHDFLDLKCDEEIVTKSVNDRTNGLITNSDALIFLPGGIGSLYELFTAIECKRCHEFDKPIVIYNLHSFYDKVLEFLEKLYDEKFARIIDKELYFVTDSVTEVLGYLDNYENLSKTYIKK